MAPALLVGNHVSDKRAEDGRSRRDRQDGGGGEPPEVTSVTELLDRIEKAADRHDPTSLGDVLHEVGNRSFGPLLLLAGLVMVAPVVGDIPGVPVLMGMVVLLSAGQLLLGRHHVWLPGWLLRRSISDSKVRKGVGWLRPVGRFVDRWSKPRLRRLTHGAGVGVAGASCVVMAAGTPLMEVVPLSANVAGIAITAYGVALIAADGLVAIFALAFSVGTFVLVARHVT